MLQVCNYGRGGANAGGRHDGGMTLEEYRSSYSLWAVLASPIIISADLRTLEARRLRHYFLGHFPHSFKRYNTPHARRAVISLVSVLVVC